MHIGQPHFRAFRALVFAVCCVAVTAVLHGIGGGATGGFPVLATAVAVTAPGAYLLGGRQRGPVALLAACLFAQTGLHVWFTAGTMHQHHYHHAGVSPTMLLVHGLAAAASALWLERGEAALAAFTDFLILLFGPALWLRSVEPVRPSVPPPGPPAAPSFPRIELELLASAATRRGPPRRSPSQ